MERTPTARQPSLESLRAQRAGLRDSMSGLELALAASAIRDESSWLAHVHEALGSLAADFRVHIDFTEGPDGLYREVLDNAPRLTEAVRRLADEHVRIEEQLVDLLAAVGASEVDVDVDAVRARGTALLGRLVRHRQRGADLVYEAYEVDIGGEV